MEAFEIDLRMPVGQVSTLTKKRSKISFRHTCLANFAEIALGRLTIESVLVQGAHSWRFLPQPQILNQTGSKLEAEGDNMI